MEVKSEVKHIRVSPRKVAIVLDQIRGKNTNVAINLLSFLPQKAADKVLRALKSAVANAKHNYHLNESALFVSKAYVGPGAIIKRFRPVSRGRAHPIKKRTSHISVFVSERGKN